MKFDLLEALNGLPVSDLSYTEWITVGMALKTEGYDCSIWDNWSRNDTRYHPGECEQKWNTFHGNDSPVKGGTIVQIAKSHGWTLFRKDNCMNWTDTIEYDGECEPCTSDLQLPTQELITYLELIFDPDDLVGYITGDVRQDDTGRWHPLTGHFDRTAGELIASLKAHPDNIGATIGDWKPAAGAWIRINPLDGNGIKNTNVTKFKYTLVESDELSIEEQNAAFRRLELPIAALVHSGGKSLHAIVHVDAANYEEYKKRVKFLYDYLEENGVPIDRQNGNPSRLSRMPGVTRNGNRQYLMDTNIGQKSWADWVNYVKGPSDGLPEIVTLADYKDNRPKLPEELIQGILRCGHKMLISGSSKAGKSFLLMELCIAIAEGKKWLGFQCRKGRVLYVNLEIDSDSCINRFFNIYEAMGMAPTHVDDIKIWNLRGYALPLNELVPDLIQRVRGKSYDAVVIDPIYKVITGDENNASEMGAFCNQFDKICAQTGCAAIYCHHHSKGAQGGKRAMDRASGSGVFARDPDAQLDMIQLKLPDDLNDGDTTAWRLESNLREFKNIEPVNFWFEYPIHRLDTSGKLNDCDAEGSWQANLSKSSKRTTSEKRKQSLDEAYDTCAENGTATIADMAKSSGLSEKSIRRYLKEYETDYICKGGAAIRRTN